MSVGKFVFFFFLEYNNNWPLQVTLKEKPVRSLKISSDESYMGSKAQLKVLECKI